MVFDGESEGEAKAKGAMAVMSGVEDSWSVFLEAVEGRRAREVGVEVEVEVVESWA